MLNICAIVGSNSNNSNTYYFVEKFLILLREKLDIDVNIKIYHLCNFEIKYCNGCMICHETGKCQLNDDVEFLKSEMINSDIIVWASPVYMNNISGIMKAFIDRMSIWIHTMRLVGKKGIVLTTTSHAGDIQVRDYLKSILWNMGVITIGNFNMYVDFPKELYSKHQEDIIIKKFIKSTIEKIKNNDDKSLLIQEVLFNDLKKKFDIAINNGLINDYEVRFWKNNDLIKYNSFNDLLKDVNTNKKILY